MTSRPPPYLAAVLTVLGGAFIAAGGLVLWALGTVLATVFHFSSPVFLLGLLDGLVTVVAGGLMLTVPAARRLFGGVAMACAVASIPFAFGGFVVGFGLTAVGGAIATARPLARTVVTTFPGMGRPPPWT